MFAAGQAQSINEDKMNAFLGKVVGDPLRINLPEMFSY